MTKGRTPPALPSVTLPESGIEVRLRPLGSMTLEEIGKAVRKEFPAPEPPMNTVIGLDGKESQEPNPADPEYAAALEAYNERLQANIVKRMLKVMQAWSVIYEPDLEQVATFRAAMAACGVELEGDDREVYFNHFILSTDRDSQELIQAVMRRSQPTEGAIDEHTDTFLGNVQGA